jgi:hypothetical protein
MWLDVKVSHSSSCKNYGLGSNATTAIVLMKVTATQTVANGVHFNHLTALTAGHQAAATSVVRMSDAAMRATANAVRIRQIEALCARNKHGYSRQRHHMITTLPYTPQDAFHDATTV